MSEYHPSVREVEKLTEKHALTGMFDDNNELLNAVDMRKAYSSRMCEINKVPVFSYFDVYEEYNNNDKIEDFNMYIVEATKTKKLNNYVQ
jgi:hypothetical protein